MYTDISQAQLGANEFLKSRAATAADKAQAASAVYPEISERGASLLDAVLLSDPVSRPTASALVKFLNISEESADGDDGRLSKALADKDAALIKVDETTSALAKKDAALTKVLAEKDAAVTEVDATISALAKKDAALTKVLAEKDAALTEVDATISALAKKDAALTKVLAEKDAALTEVGGKNASLAEIYAHNLELTRKLAEKDAALDALDAKNYALATELAAARFWLKKSAASMQ